jgi:hypothetical protein
MGVGRGANNPFADNNNNNNNNNLLMPIVGGHEGSGTAVGYEHVLPICAK